MSAEYPSKEELKARRESERISTGGLAAGDLEVRAPAESTGRKMSAQIMRLADRLGMDPDELAADYPEDTVRRTKYPAVEEPQEDGSVLYKDKPVL